MRVLYVIHDFLPRHAAGSQVYAFDLAKSVRSRGHEVSFFTTEIRPGDPPLSIRRHEVAGLPVCEVAQKTEARRLSDSFGCPELEGLFAAEVEALKPDVIHYHHLIHLSLRLPERVGKRPQVFTLHDYWLTCPRGGQRLDWNGEICEQVDLSKCARCLSNFYSDISLPGRLAEQAEALAASFFPAPPFGGLLRRFAREAVKKSPAFLGLPPKHDEKECLSDLEERWELVSHLFKRIDRFVAPSRFLADRLREAGLPPEKLLVSDYGFADGLKAAPKASSLPLRVGYMGTLVPHKGLHVLVEAFAHLKEVPAKLSLFGDPGAFPSYTALLRAKAKNLPVSFEGGFDPAKRTEILAKIDLLVLPSIWWENSPLTIHEAFLAKIPVLVPRLGAFPELVREEIDGLFYEPGDPQSLAAQIRSFCENENLRNKLRSDPARVKSIGADAEWTIRLYEELCTTR